MGKNNILFLLMGGSGQRFLKTSGQTSDISNLPKQYQILESEKLPLFSITLDRLFEICFFSRVFLAMDTSFQQHPNFIAGMSYIQSKYPLLQWQICPAGSSRFLSFLSCLQQYRQIRLETDHGLCIHDANRPYLLPDFLQRNRQIISQLNSKMAGFIPVIEATDSQLRLDPSGKIKEYLPRQEVKKVQTPQWFHLPTFFTLLDACYFVNPVDFPNEYTDEGSFFLELIRRKPGSDLFHFDGDIQNVKITYYNDLQ